MVAAKEIALVPDGISQTNCVKAFTHNKTKPAKRRINCQRNVTKNKK